MVDLRILMSPEKRAHYDRVNSEIGRLFSLPTRFLARALVRHARNARDRHPDFLALNACEGNKTMSALVWDVVPELCFRMGERSEIQGERRAQVRAMSDTRFRTHAGFIIMGASGIFSDGQKRVRNAHDVDPFEILTHDVANGNPVAFAIDRIVPAHNLRKEDVLSRYTQEVSGNRGFEPPYLMWEPQMQSYGHLKKTLASSQTLTA